MEGLSKLKIKNQCIECDLRSKSFFCELAQNNSPISEPLKMTNYYAKGSRLFIEGQPSTGVYMLCRGSVKLSTCSKDGKVIILHIAEAGDILGLSATVSELFHIATAEAIESCRVDFVEKKDFLRFLEHNPKACFSVLKQLSHDYHTACQQICALGLFASVADKLATLFLGWADKVPEESDGIHIKITYTHEDIAQMIGTSRETVTRILKNFKDRKLIKRKGSELIIPDRSKLEAVIGSRQKTI